eukprot:gb/GFBE01030369.1/.p1 GENE.gb/GFBE01030369.1/~~gb/GFBE01030369.1/.p1  ORF type:complete len:200 (+),score=66.72 gb/GFBE01030369.1/:1-600(+)
MATMKDRVLEVALVAARYGGSWWMPLVLLAVCIVNVMAAGALTFSVGLLQVMLFNIVVLSRKYTFFLGPLMLSIGSIVGGYTYVQIMKTQGAEALLESTGAKGSDWLAKATGYAEDYGVLGLLFLQIVPIPIPTAVIVIAGMVAKMDEFKVLTVIFLSKLTQLTITALVVKYVSENQTPEEFIRSQMDGGAAEDEKKED